MAHQMKEAMQEALKSKTIKFEKPKNSSSESAELRNFPPSFSLSTTQLDTLKKKDIGDECNFYVTTTIVGIRKDEKNPANYNFDVDEMTYVSSKKNYKEEEDKEDGTNTDIKKAYPKKEKEKQYVALETTQVNG